MDETPRPWTVERIAERWECSGQHVRDVIQSGELQHFRIGRLVRVPHAALEAFEARNLSPPPPADIEAAAGEGPRRALSVADVAKHWGCSGHIVRKAIARGDLKSFRVGSLVRTWPEWVAEFEEREEKKREEQEKTRAEAETTPPPEKKGRYIRVPSGRLLWFEGDGQWS